MRNTQIRLAALGLLSFGLAAFPFDGVCQADPIKSANPDAGIDSLRIENIQLLANGVSVSELRESPRHVLRLSNHFSIKCNVGLKDPNPDRNEFLVWTTIDFLVAETSVEYQKMSDSELAQAVSWGQIAEMHDVIAEPLYLLKANEPVAVNLQTFDLTDVLSAFPPDQNLWPYLMRINIHVQDAFGTQLGVAQKTFPIRPTPNRFRKR